MMPPNAPKLQPTVAAPVAPPSLKFELDEIILHGQTRAFDDGQYHIASEMLRAIAAGHSVVGLRIFCEDIVNAYAAKRNITIEDWKSHEH